MRKEEQKLSVFLLTYNREKLLPGAIDTILNQTYKDFTLYILDNASTDNTKKIIEGYTDERIKYIRNKENIGMIGNWNNAWNSCKTKYVSILQDDDLYEPDLFQSQIEVMEKYPKVLYAVTNQYLWEEESNEVKLCYEDERDNYIEEGSYERINYTVGSAMYRYEMIRKGKLRFEKSTMAGDIIFKAKTLPYDIYFIAKPLTKYRISYKGHESASEKFYLEDIKMINILIEEVIKDNVPVELFRYIWDRFGMAEKYKKINFQEDIDVLENTISAINRLVDFAVSNQVNSIAIPYHLLVFDVLKNGTINQNVRKIADKSDMALFYENIISKKKCSMEMRNQKIAIWGTSQTAELLFLYLTSVKVEVAGFVQSRDSGREKFCGKAVEKAEDIQKFDLVIIAVTSKKTAESIKAQAKENGAQKVVWWRELLQDA